ncbi:MAG: hypothetical protein KAU20_07300, partial [Nanoarchaeota archaeon]|nr:hypothetical protein [Nanoarchaeota archaeon]
TSYETIIKSSVKNIGDYAVENVELRVPIPNSLLNDPTLKFSELPAQFESDEAVFKINLIGSNEEKSVSYSLKSDSADKYTDLLEEKPKIINPDIEVNRTKITGFVAFDSGYSKFNKDNLLNKEAKCSVLFIPVFKIPYGASFVVLLSLTVYIALFIFSGYKKEKISKKQMILALIIIIAPLAFAFYPFDFCIMMNILLIEFVAWLAVWGIVLKEYFK